MSAGIQPVPNRLPGVDVSHYQGAIEWSKVAGSGIEFAFIKATDGTVRDPNAITNATGARAARVPFGLYHFWRPGVDWQLQAAAFAAACDTAACEIAFNQTESWIALPAVLDIETGALTEANQQDALNWLARVRGLYSPERLPIVYVSPSYADLNLTDPAWTEYPLWVAQYTDLPAPRTSHWKDWLFWQWACNGTVAGIENQVDLDWFNGTDLSALLNPAPPTAA